LPPVRRLAPARRTRISAHFSLQVTVQSALKAALQGRNHIGLSPNRNARQFSADPIGYDDWMIGRRQFDLCQSDPPRRGIVDFDFPCEFGLGHQVPRLS